MPKSNFLNILSKTFGSFLILMGTTLLFLKNIREHISFLKPYSFELFLLSPIFIIFGLNLACKNTKIKCIHMATRLLLGVAMIYLVILSASWVSINILY